MKCILITGGMTPDSHFVASSLGICTLGEAVVAADKVLEEREAV